MVSAHPFLECGQWSVYLLKLQEILHSLISDCFYSMIHFFTNKLSIFSLRKGLFRVSNDQLLAIFRRTRLAQSPRGHATHAPRPVISAPQSKAKLYAYATIHLGEQLFIIGLVKMSCQPNGRTHRLIYTSNSFTISGVLTIKTNISFVSHGL